MIGPILADITIPGLEGFLLRLPDPAGLFSGGLLSGLGTVAQFAFAAILLVWIVLSILAGIKIVRSQGNPDEMKEGMTKLKNVWIAVSIFFGFFMIMSIIGAVVGFGTPLEWGNSLAQCGGFDGPFYFSQIDQQTAYYHTKFDVNISDDEKGYCCIYDASANSFALDPDSPVGFVSPNLGINNNGKNWYLPLSKGSILTSVNSDGEVIVNGSSGATGFTKCTEFGK